MDEANQELDFPKPAAGAVVLGHGSDRGRGGGGDQRVQQRAAARRLALGHRRGVTLPSAACDGSRRGDCHGAGFRGRGTITVAPVRAVRASLPYGTSLSAAGAGIDVTFSGVTLMGVTGSVPRRTPAP